MLSYPAKMVRSAARPASALTSTSVSSRTLRTKAIISAPKWLGMTVWSSGICSTPAAVRRKSWFA